jgi:hypothetical protein
MAGSIKWLENLIEDFAGNTWPLVGNLDAQRVSLGSEDVDDYRFIRIAMNAGVGAKVG